MNMFQEIAEARLFRQLGRLEGLSRSEMARKFFVHMMGLRVLWEEDPRAAQEYARTIMRWPDFDGFRSVSNDLYNITAVLMNPERFADRVSNDMAFAVPELRLRRIMRELQRGQLDRDDFDNFMMILQRNIPDLGGPHMALRREISDYQRLTPAQRVSMLRRLLLLIREHEVFTDLHMLMVKHIKLPGLAL